MVSIGLLLALGIGMYAAMSSMSMWRRDSADASFAALGMHDLRLSLAEGSYVSAGTLRQALHGIADRRLVTASEERLVVPTQVDATRGRRTTIVPGRLIGAPVSATVDRMAVVRGRKLSGNDGGAAVGELERNFAKHYGLPSTGIIRLAGDRQLRYLGQAEAPEYFIVTAPGADFGAEANFAAVFVPLATAQSLSGQTGRVNQLVLRVGRRADVAAVQSQISHSLRRALPATGFTFTRAGQEPARRLIYKDAEGDQQLMDIFALLLLGAAAFAAFNLVSRAVEAQRREIGIGMALGVEPGALARRPLMLGGQVALIGIGLGVPAGLAANAWLRSVMETFFPLPVFRTPLELAVFARGAALGLVLCLLATALPLRRALRVTPVEAIRVGARAAKSSGLAWMVRGVRLPGGSLGNLPVRNVLRTPRRTIMTMLGIGAVVTIVVALAGMIDSFDATSAASRKEALVGAKQRLTVDLSAPTPTSSPTVAQVTGSPAVRAAQTSLRLPSTLIAGRRHIDAFTEVVSPVRRIWRPSLRHGLLSSTTPGLVIAQRAAEDLHLHIGDQLTVRHPVPTGSRSYQLVSTRLTVTGIHTSPFRFLAYANQQAGSLMHIAGLTNRISVVPARGHTPNSVKTALLNLPSVTAVQGAAAATDAVDQAMAQFTDVLVVTVALAVIMALLIAFNSAAINTEERAREHATMFSYGVATGRVVSNNMIESLLMGLLGTGLGIAAGYGVLRWMVTVVTPNTMPDIGTLVSIAPLTYALAALAGTVIVALAPLLTLHRLRRTDIPATLRVVE